MQIAQLKVLWNNLIEGNSEESAKRKGRKVGYKAGLFFNLTFKTSSGETMNETGENKTEEALDSNGFRIAKTMSNIVSTLAIDERKKVESVEKIVILSNADLAQKYNSFPEFFKSTVLMEDQLEIMWVGSLFKQTKRIEN